MSHTEIDQGQLLLVTLLVCQHARGCCTTNLSPADKEALYNTIAFLLESTFFPIASTIRFLTGLSLLLLQNWQSCWLSDSPIYSTLQVAELIRQNVYLRSSELFLTGFVRSIIEFRVVTFALALDLQL